MGLTATPRVARTAGRRARVEVWLACARKKICVGMCAPSPSLATILRQLLAASLACSENPPYPTTVLATSEHECVSEWRMYAPPLHTLLENSCGTEFPHASGYVCMLATTHCAQAISTGSGLTAACARVPRYPEVVGASQASLGGYASARHQLAAESAPK